MLAKAGTLTTRKRHHGLTWARVICPFRNYHGVNFILIFFPLSTFRVRLVERGSPHSLPLMESGKVVEVGVDSAGMCVSGEYDTVWGVGLATEEPRNVK